MLRDGVTRAVLMAHGYRCRYCAGVAVEADHIVPSILGGSDSSGNLTASCRPCNGRKGGKRLAVALEKELLIEAYILAPFVDQAARHYRAGIALALKRGKLAEALVTVEI
jgi:hypothetical protein